MKQFLIDFFGNRILICSLSSWLVAQVLKTLIYACNNREFRLERLFGDGGMPSCHSATVTAMAVSTGITYGVGSTEFALALIIAIIVMHDAMGVRRETGNQAVIINEMMQLFTQEDKKIVFHQERLKELIGHSPMQVICGCIVGIAVAIGFCTLF